MLGRCSIDIAGEGQQRLAASRPLTRQVSVETVTGGRCLYRKNIRFDLKMILRLQPDEKKYIRKLPLLM